MGMSVNEVSPGCAYRGRKLAWVRKVWLEDRGCSWLFFSRCLVVSVSAIGDVCSWLGAARNVLRTFLSCFPLIFSVFADIGDH